MTDVELLAMHRQGSRFAFADLVRKHIGWVYGVARRRLRDAHLAEDVAQAVFVLLHRKAPQFASDGAMIGWLHKTAWYATETAARDERRRRRRETEAAALMPTETQEPNDEWRELAPLLDELIGKLGRADREAILLRYYRDLSIAEVAAQIGATPEAARKRVDRAVEKLRHVAGSKGLTLSAAGLPGLLAAYVRLVPPPGLVATATVTATAASGSALAGSSAVIVKGALLMTASTKLTVIVTAIVAAIILIGGAVATTMLLTSPAKTTVIALPRNPPANTPTLVAPGMPEMHGRVLAADGTPVGGATVVMALPGAATSIQNGKITSANPRRSVTGADGEYHLPVQTGQFELVAITNTGFGQADQDAVAANPDIQLAPWGRVQGRLMVGSRPGAAMDLRTATTQDRTGRAVQVSVLSTARTDGEGNFTMDRVWPGRIQLTRNITQQSGSNRFIFSAPLAMVDVVGGQTATMNVGGVGRPVVGKFVYPPEIKPTDYFINARAIPAGGSAGAGVYLLEVDSQHNFRINGVQPGDYRIHILMQPVGGGNRTEQPGMANFTMPDIPGGVSDEALVIADIALVTGGAVPGSARPGGVAAANIDRGGPTANGLADNRSAAFSGVRWDGDKEQVLVGQTWYALVAFDGVPAEKIIQFAKENYGDSDPANPLWKKRVSEDLVEVLTKMNHAPNDVVSLDLLRPDNGQAVTIPKAPMTRDNRSAILDANNAAPSAGAWGAATAAAAAGGQRLIRGAPGTGSPFTAVRWMGDTPLVKVNGKWYEFLDVDGISLDQILASAKVKYPDSTWVGWYKRQFLQSFGKVLRDMGHNIGMNVSLKVRNLDTNAVELIGSTLVTPNNQLRSMEFMRSSPFEKIRWVSGTPQVEVNATWYEFVSMDGHTLAELNSGKGDITFASRETWMYAGWTPGETVKLELKAIDTHEPVTLPDVPLTPDNLQSQQLYSLRSPFTGVRWPDGPQAATTPEVQVKGTWYELVSINHHAPGLLGPPEQRHLLDSLAPWLAGMGDSVADTVDLELQTLDTKQPVTMSDVRMTLENHNALVGWVPGQGTMNQNGFQEGPIFGTVRWDGQTPQVQLSGMWYELIGIDDSPIGDVIAFAKKQYGGDWQKDQFEDRTEKVMNQFGHTLFLPPSSVVMLHLKTLETGEAVKVIKTRPTMWTVLPAQ